MRQPVCLLLLLLAMLFGGVRAAPPNYDFRILIDVSASMKQTDPQNLRVPALKLLNGLIPGGSHAGVWTFGKYVDIAVKWGRVDARWRRDADLGADGIHSNARLTNLESALARARVGWDAAVPGSRRILLLLTDGGVEISSDPEKNRESRRRLLGENLAALKKAGAEIHAIALSDAADEALLKRLALETGGSFATARGADELQKTFYRMFERASNPDTVEFDGKEFRIDAGIREMTLLIFHQPGSEPTLLIPPDSPAISARKPRGSRWHSDEGYDLVTVTRPQTGTWRIDAEMDPDNRLMVVSDLSLEVGGLPAYARPRDALRVTAELFNGDKKIRKNSFLRFVDFDVTHTDANGNEKRYRMSHTDERKDKGQYLLDLPRNLAEGMHGFVVTAGGRSFSRSKRFDLQVQRPVEVSIAEQPRAGVYVLQLRAREEYLKADGMAAEVSLEAPDGTREDLPMETTGGGARGTVETVHEGLYHAHVRVSAQNHAGEIHDYDLGSFPMRGVYRPPPAEPAAEVSAPGSVPAGTGESVDGVDWRLVGIVVVGVNVSLMLLLLGGWLVVRRRRRQADEVMFDDEELGA